MSRDRARHYDRAMTDGNPPQRVIEGRLARKVSNALTLTFRDGPGEPLGIAQQCAADGVGRKLGVLFGFKNGGSGTHLYTPRVGEPMRVETRDREPTLLTRSDGSPLGTIERGETCIGRDVSGAEVLRWTANPDGETPEAYRLLVSAPNDELVAHLNVIRTVRGWSLGQDLIETTIWWGQAGQSLPLPLLGTSATIVRPLTPAEERMLMASCIDLAIGLRGYGRTMA